MSEPADLETRHLPDLKDPELAPFWEGCRKRELRVPRCLACAKLVWYPQLTCNRCGSGDLLWTLVSGRGRLFTWVKVHRAFLPGFESRTPFVTALVELEEDPGVRMASMLDNPSSVPLRIGLSVEVAFDRVSPELVLPRFRVLG